MSNHTIVWLDHKEAHIYQMEAGSTVESTVRAPHLVHKHPGGSDRTKDHPDELRRFFQEIAQALGDSKEIIVVGPSSAKLEFLRHVRKQDHVLESKIVGIETVDHPTGPQLVAYAKEYFHLEA